MDFSRRRSSPNRNLVTSDSQRTPSPKMVIDENTRPGLAASSLRDRTKHFMSPTSSSSSKKRILGDRNQQVEDLGQDYQKMVTSASPHQAPYHPVTNYLSPRPQYRRYSPKRHREFLVRMEEFNAQEEEEEEELRSPVSVASVQEVHQENESDANADEDEEEEEEEETRCSTMVCKLLLVLGALVGSTCYISSMNPPCTTEKNGVVLDNPLMIQDWNPPIEGNLSIFSGSRFDSLVGSLDTSWTVHRPRGEVSLEEITKSGELEGEESHGWISSSVLEDSRTEDGELNDGNGLIPTNEQTLLVERSFGGSFHLRDSAGIGEDTQRKYLEEMESYDELANSNLGDSITEEYELNDEIALVTQNVQNMLVNGSLEGKVSVAGEKNEEAVDSHELQRQESYYELSSTSFRNTTTVEDELNDGIALDGEEAAPEEKNEEAGDSHEFLVEEQQVPQSHVVLKTHTDDGIRETIEENWEMSQLTTSSTEDGIMKAIEVEWELNRFWICLVTAVLGFFSALYKYLLKFHKSSQFTSPPCSETVIEGKAIKGAAFRNEKIETKVMESDLNVVGIERTCSQNLERSAEDLENPAPLNHSINEEELYASRPPVVELLGEFSVVEPKSYESCSGQIERSGVEVLQVCKSTKTRSATKKNISSTANNFLPSSPAESVSNGSFSVQVTQLKKEDAGHREGKIMTAPLRRSGRHRSRVTTPLI